MYPRQSGVSHVFVVASVTDMSDVSCQIALSYFLPESSEEHQMITTEICTLEAMARIVNAEVDSQVKVVIGKDLAGRQLLARLTERTSKLMEPLAVARSLPPAITFDFEAMRRRLPAASCTVLTEIVQGLSAATSGGIARAKSDGATSTKVAEKLMKELEYFKGPAFELTSQTQIARLKGEPWAEGFACNSLDDLMICLSGNLGAATKDREQAKQWVVVNLVRGFGGLSRALDNNVGWNEVVSRS